MSGHCLGLILGWSPATIELIINPRGLRQVQIEISYIALAGD